MKPFFSSASGVKLEYDIDTTRQRLKASFAKGFAYLRCRTSEHGIWGDCYHDADQSLIVKEELDRWERDH